MASSLTRLALDYHRCPLAYPRLADAQRPLPLGFGDWLSELCSDLSSAQIADTSAMLGVDPSELRRAGRFLVRHLLLDAPSGDYYRHLGLTPRASQETIHHHYQMLIRLFHPDRLDSSDETEGFHATRINLAHRTLRDPHTREAYDRGLAPSLRDAAPTDPISFFRRDPSPLGGTVTLALAAGGRSGPLLKGRRALRLAGVLAIAFLAMAAYLLLQRNSEPPLRRSTDGAPRAIMPLPSFLSGSGVPAGLDGPAQAVRNHDLSRTAGPGAAERIAGGSDAGVGSARDSALGGLAVEGDAADLPLRSPSALRPEISAHPVGTEAVGPSVEPATGGVRDQERGTRSGVSTATEPSVSTSSGSAERLATDRSIARVAAPSVRTPVPSGGAGTASASARAAVIPPGPSAAGASNPSQDSPASGSGASPISEQEAASLVMQLQAAYGARSGEGFAALFTSDARINEGQGQVLIRSEYADLFRRTSGAKLSIGGLGWRSMPNGRISGTGSMAVANQYRPGGVWQHATGRIELDLVRDTGGVRIERMIYHLK